jgi:hypothetical protein
MDQPDEQLSARRGLVAAAAVLLTLGALLPARLAAKGCAESLLGQPLQPPSNLWGDVQPQSVLLDATNWTGSQLANMQYPISMAVDIENGWIFHAFYGGLSIWDARTDPANPARVVRLGGWEGQIPNWGRGGEFNTPVIAIDAPAGVDTIMALGGYPTIGLTIWDTTTKSMPRQLYQDYGDKFTWQVYAARIAGRDYVFAASFTPGGDQGVFVYDMTTARNYTACYENRSSGQVNCPGVYLAEMDPAYTKYVSGLQAGSRHFLVTSGGDTSSTGIKIWDISSPTAPILVVQDFQGFGTWGATHGVAMWTNAGRHYLAARRSQGSTESGYIFDITTCLTTGCANLQSLQLWQSPQLKPFPDSQNWLSSTASHSGSVPFVHFGHFDPCRDAWQAPLRSEYLYNVSNPAQPVDVSPTATTVHEGITVDYWSWYYSDFFRGFAHFYPRMAKFHGEYLYRAAGTIFDVHKIAGVAAPPVANFTWSPDPVYSGEPISFANTSSGDPTTFAWTFQDGNPTTGSGSSTPTTFTSPGGKSASVDVINAHGVFTNPGVFQAQLAASRGTTTALAEKPSAVARAPRGKVALVPWVAQSDDAEVELSDLYLYNPGPQAAHLTISYRNRGVPQPNPPQLERTLPPAATLEVLALLGQLHVSDTSGFIFVEAQDGDPQPMAAGFHSRFVAGKRFGEMLPGFTLSDTAASTGPSVSHLIGLQDTTERGTGFGITNPGFEPVTYSLRFFDADGTLLGSQPARTLPGFGQEQLDRAAQQALGVNGESDYRIEIETDGGDTVFPFAAGRWLGSQDPTLLSAQREGGGTRQYLLGMVNGLGARRTRWSSDAVLVNPTDQPMAVTLRFVGALGQGKVSGPRRKQLRAGATLRLEDVLEQEFGIEIGSGVVVVDSPGAGGVYPLVLGDAYNTGAANPHGDLAAAVDERALPAAGGAQVIIGLRDDRAFDASLWLYNPLGQSARAELTFRALDGRTLATMITNVGAGKVAIVPVRAKRGLPRSYEGAFTVEVAGRVLAGAEMVDEGTSDRAFTFAQQLRP